MEGNGWQNLLMEKGKQGKTPPYDRDEELIGIVQTEERIVYLFDPETEGEGDWAKEDAEALKRIHYLILDLCKRAKPEDGRLLRRINEILSSIESPAQYASHHAYAHWFVYRYLQLRQPYDPESEYEKTLQSIFGNFDRAIRVNREVSALGEEGIDKDYLVQEATFNIPPLIEKILAEEPDRLFVYELQNYLGGVAVRCCLQFTKKDIPSLGKGLRNDVENVLRIDDLHQMQRISTSCLLIRQYIEDYAKYNLGHDLNDPIFNVGYNSKRDKTKIRFAFLGELKDEAAVKAIYDVYKTCHPGIHGNISGIRAKIGENFRLQSKKIMEMVTALEEKLPNKGPFLEMDKVISLLKARNEKILQLIERKKEGSKEEIETITKQNECYDVAFIIEHKGNLASSLENCPFLKASEIVALYASTSDEEQFENNFTRYLEEKVKPLFKPIPTFDQKDLQIPNGLSAPKEDFGRINVPQFQQKRAKKGLNAHELFVLGFAYQFGIGIKKANLQEAYGCYKSASEAGYGPANNNLGYFKEKGIFIPPNPNEAFKLYEAAASSAVPEAFYNLGRCYQNGLGTEKDFQKAEEKYGVAEALGFAPAKEALKNLDQWRTKS